MSQPGYLVRPEAVYEEDQEHGIITLPYSSLPVRQLQKLLGLGCGKDGIVSLILLREDELQLFENDRVPELPILLLDVLEEPVQGNELIPDRRILIASRPEMIPISKDILTADL